MRIAILGATSQIARDLIVLFSVVADKHIHLFARRPVEVMKWLTYTGLNGRYLVDDFSQFGNQTFDAILNFIGVGNPAQAATMGNTIIDTTLRFDEMVLEYLKLHPACRYLFLSSGAAYGSNFTEPVSSETPACFRINDLAPQDWYGISKMHAECRHRAHPEFTIFDIRVFNYFSRTQDMKARFLITDIIRAIREKTKLTTSSDNIVRDFLHPSDFYRLVCALFDAPASNVAVDCYSRAPIDKFTLLRNMEEHFGLRYQVVDTSVGVNATGNKLHYYSLGKRLADFGYEPHFSSLEGILIEAKAALS